MWYTIIEYRYSSRLNKIPLILRRIAILITIAFSIWSVFMDQTTVNHNIVEWWGVYALIFGFGHFL